MVRVFGFYLACMLATQSNQARAIDFKKALKQTVEKEKKEA